MSCLVAGIGDFGPRTNNMIYEETLGQPIRLYRVMLAIPTVKNSGAPVKKLWVPKAQMSSPSWQQSIRIIVPH